MVQKVIEVCDVCEDMRREVKSYSVTSEGRSVEKTLCSTHARPLEVLLGAAKRPGRPRGSKATSMAEIEALKKK